MISLANILFGDKKPANITKQNNYNHNQKAVKHIDQREKSLGNNIRNTQPESINSK
jgi:hypothetical protein